MRQFTHHRVEHYKNHDFQKLWKYFPLRRSTKEKIKWTLFSLFPFLFKKWVIYHNWKNARVFSPEPIPVWKPAFWKRNFGSQYTVPIRKGGSPKPEHVFKTAVVIHVYYPEIFREILDRLQKLPSHHISIYVTTTAELRSRTEKMLAGLPFPFVIRQVENRGRDILPFLLILPEIIRDGHNIILKLHTKYSNHLARKEHWRFDLLNKLIGDDALAKNLEIFRQNPSVGIIGPHTHILPMHLYYGANAARVAHLAQDMGISSRQLRGLNFVAGSMFIARTSALKPLLELKLTPDMFEPENNQTDGTMAHAVERSFSLGLIKSGLQLADSGYDPDKPVLHVSKAHYFTI